MQLFSTPKCASVAYINHAKIDEEFDDMFNLHCLAAVSALVIAHIVLKRRKTMPKQAISYFRGDNVACRPSEISAFFIILTLVSK